MGIRRKVASRLAVSFAALVILGLTGITGGFSSVRAGDTSDVDDSSPKVVTYYFYTTARCATCRKLEAFAQEVIEQDFSEALQSGRLEWRPVNVQEQGNGHFIQDYNLVTKSLVLVRMKDQEQVSWKNLDKIWQLVWNKEDYQSYVRSELQDFMGTPGIGSPFCSFFLPGLRRSLLRESCPSGFERRIHYCIADCVWRGNCSTGHRICLPDCLQHENCCGNVRKTGCLREMGQKDHRMGLYCGWHLPFRDGLT